MFAVRSGVPGLDPVLVPGTYGQALRNTSPATGVVQPTEQAGQTAPAERSGLTAPKELVGTS